jgi:hypothetical protein
MWRFRKVFAHGPFRWTLSKHGLGWSWGIPGFRYGVSPLGQRYVSFSIPGTGMYWIKYLKDRPAVSLPPTRVPPPSSLPPTQPAPPSTTSARQVPWWKQKGL